MTDKKFPCFEAGAVAGAVDPTEQWAVDKPLGESGVDWLLKPNIKDSNLVGEEIETPAGAPYSHQMYVEGLVPQLYSLVSLGPNELANDNIAVSGTVRVGDQLVSVNDEMLGISFGVCEGLLKMFVESSKYEGSLMQLMLKYNKLPE